MANINVALEPIISEGFGRLIAQLQAEIIILERELDRQNNELREAQKIITELSRKVKEDAALNTDKQEVKEDV